MPRRSRSSKAEPASTPRRKVKKEATDDGEYHDDNADADIDQESPSPSASPSNRPPAPPIPTKPSPSSQTTPPTTTPANPTHNPYPSTTSTSLRMSYRIARGEQGVLTFEPYKSHLLPLWRFRTVPIAHASSSALWSRFLDYDRAGDFVGMDMARKFIQMGMTRAKRYANHKGGRKYDKVSGVELEKSQGHEGREEKEEASGVFREVWERCRGHAGYQRRKEVFLKEQKEWDRRVKRGEVVVDGLTGQEVGEEDQKVDGVEGVRGKVGGIGWKEMIDEIEDEKKMEDEAKIKDEKKVKEEDDR